MYHIYYWMAIVITVIGTVMLASLLREVGIDTQPITLPLFWVFIGLFILFLIYKYGIRREKFEWIQMDERVQAVIDKSARNALIVTWLCMFIFVDFEAPDASSLLVVVAAGLAVWIVSYFIYLFKSG